jgi:uncharacterized cupin superfamily protein
VERLEPLVSTAWPSGAATPPMHAHPNEDEWYYLFDGEVTFHVGQGD